MSTATKNSTKSITDRIEKIREHLGDCYNRVSDGTISANSIQTRLEKIDQLLENLADSL